MADNTNNLYFKIGLVTKGAYSATATYAVNDTVQASDGLYASRKSNNTGHALSETEWWAKIIDLTAAAAATSAATTAAGAANTAAANAGEKIRELEGYQEELQTLQNDVNRIYSDFAEYDKTDHPDIVFGTPTQSGAIVNGNGVVVPMSGYNVSNPIAVTKGLLYKLFIGVGASIPENIAVFAIRRVSEDGRVVYTPAFVSNNTTKVSRLGYLVFFASENAEIVVSYPTTTTKIEVAEYGVLKSLATQIDNLRKEVDLKSFADGYYAQMSVGYARNLIMPNTPTEQEFSHRQSGGGVIESGVSTYDKVMGRSLVWNQVLNVVGLASHSENGVTFTFNADNSILVNGTAEAEITYKPKGWTQIVKSGHKVYFSSHSTNEGVYLSNGYIREGSIWNGAAESLFVIKVTNGTVCNNVLLRPQYVDLTRMFGAGNEPTTYEEFLQRKPIVEDEYAYDEGTIINNKVEKVVSADTDGAEVGVLDLGWIKDIKDENGVALFEDGMRSAGSAYDEAGARKAVKRMGVSDMGTLPFATYIPVTTKKVYYSGIDAMKQGNAGFLCEKYTTVPWGVLSSMAEGTLMTHPSLAYIYICDSSKETADELRAYLSGTEGNYELETPIEVEYSPKSMSLEVVAGGTETAIATEDSTPMRAMIAYGIDAVATILSLVNRVAELERRVIN